MINIYNASHNNLKNISLSIPKGCIVSICGVSGSGKSTLAYDIIYSEGQRRYIEALSNYAKQFLSKVEKPKVEKIENLSPTICVDQRIKNFNPRSTIGTVTEIYDYLRLIFAHYGKPYCPNCNIPIVKLESHQIIDKIFSNFYDKKITILCPLVRQAKGDHKILIDKVRKLGFTKLLVNGLKVDVDDEIVLNKNQKNDIDILIDVVTVNEENKLRILNSVNLSLDTSLKLGKFNQRIVKIVFEDKADYYSSSFGCINCGFSYPEITWRLFSFNNPIGACETCKGIGSVIDFRIDDFIDLSLSIEEGAIKFLGKPNFSYNWPKLSYWWTKIKDFCKKYGIEFDEKLNTYNKEVINYFVEGDGEFEGLKTFLEDIYYNYDFDIEFDHLVCPSCKGYRLNKNALSIKMDFSGELLNIGQLCEKNIKDIYNLFSNSFSQMVPGLANLVESVIQRLRFLLDMDLWYLDLYRSIDSLSSGEFQRVKIASLLSSNISGVIYVLDEPTIGLHPYNIDSIIKSLKQLKDLGNTVIVVEHDPKVIENSDFFIELGYEGGTNGGYLLSCDFLDKVKDSETISYVRNTKTISFMEKDYLDEDFPGRLVRIRDINMNNIKNANIEFPLNSLVVITGISGSGKTSLLKAIYHSLKGKNSYGVLEDSLDVSVYFVDQKPIGRTPRSCLATYTKVFDHIRNIFASLPESKRLGFTSSHFSFNMPYGRCDRCKGEGFIKLEMNFLPDVYVKCESCEGKRYSYDVLIVKFNGYSIADILDLTVDECIEVFKGFKEVTNKLIFLSKIGLGYMKLGQISPTYSGGEVQRIKLAQELTKRTLKNNIYLIDEPTTGLHFKDVEKLLNIFYEMLKKGATIVLVEHNLDIIKNGDWIIDVGPKASFEGGKIIFQGTLKEFINNNFVYSITKDYLFDFLNKCETTTKI